MKKINLNKKEVWRAVKYLLFVSSAGVVQFVTFTLLNEIIKMSYWPAYLIALILSVVWNFTFNRKFTFRTVANIGIAMLEVLGYYVVFTPLSILWGNALIGIGWNEYLVLSITMIIKLITEYLFYILVVYKKSIDSAIEKEELKEEIKDI
jgi:putative flippase GtrA